MKWARSQVFERTSNIYTFSKNPLLRKNSRRHLFIPWKESVVHNLMFKLKKALRDKGECYIPFMESDLSPASLSAEALEQLKAQIGEGAETHLVMSNLDCIHIFRVDDISEKKATREETIEEFGDSEKYRVWIKVGDLYVHKANHVKDSNEIEESLEELICSPQTQNLFVPAQALELSSDSGEKRGQFSRWLELNRDLTYDYFIRSCELRENVYQECWQALNRRTQHFLIMAEQARHKGIMYRDEEKTRFLKESLENYLSAVINELNEVYVRPLIKAFKDYPCMAEAWEETRSGLVHPEMRDIINGLLESGGDQIGSIEVFLAYLRTAKSFLFSLKTRFTKRIGKEEYLLIENFLCRQESLVESFSCKRLDQKLESVLAVKNWLKGVIECSGALSPADLKDANLKLTHLLTIMCSTSYEDNVFFKLIEEKAAKGVVKRSFEDEVKALLKLKLAKKPA